MWLWRTIARSPAGRSTMTDGDEVQRPVEIAVAKREVGGADRRDEAVVERLRQAGRPVEAVPARLDRELVQAELARVEEAEQLDPLEVRFEQLPVLALVVLAQVPGVVGL